MKYANMQVDVMEILYRQIPAHNTKLLIYFQTSIACFYAMEKLKEKIPRLPLKINLRINSENYKIIIFHVK
jgi:hypothetical protein